MLVYAISLSIVLLDQLAKFLALRYLAGHESLPVMAGIFHLTLVRNPGIAFGLFHDRAGRALLLIIFSLAVLLVVVLEMKHAAWSQRLSLSFVLGGALGNLVDRMRYGYVVDFLDFRIWPVFNIADSFITVGVCLFLVATFRSR